MTVDISIPLTDLCEALGIDKTNVKVMTLYPGHVKALVYKTTETGSKYIEPESNQAAIEFRNWNVTT